MVNVGIFWVIRGEIFYKKQQKDERNKSGKIDSDFGHFYEWDDLCGRRFPRADFASFPRGRVLFDVEKGESIVYVDECVSEEKRAEIAKLFELENYRIEYDEHYTCDRCIRRKRGLFQ